MNVIVTLNAGSSSLKFGLYDLGAEPALIVSGQAERLGPAARLILNDGPAPRTTDLGAADHAIALSAIFQALAPYLNGRSVAGIGHRIVHGGVDYAAPQRLTPDVVAKLETLIPLAPLHQPHNLACFRAALALFPDAPQLGCFDTGFHRGHPWVNDTFALPRSFYGEGVRRYGFHGLSYDYITSVLATDYPDLHDARVVIAHLGNGASMCAVRGGKSVGSTMGFSALDGLPMGTRCGQIDPGVLLYLMDQKGMDAARISDLLYKESGLKGLSGISGDMRSLQDSPAPEAAQAIDYYVFRIRRELGAMAAVLGGLDALVFTGGIGENSAPIRARVCDGMGWLGIGVDAAANKARAVEIGTGAVRVLVIPTDEEQVIARAVAGMLRI